MGKGTSKVLGTTLVGVLLAFLMAGCQGSGGPNGGGPNSGNTDGQTQTPSGILLGDAALPPAVTTVTNPNPGSFQPLGNIQGVVRDAITGFAIVGARVSLAIPGVSGDTTVTTGQSGQFAFANVPASRWGDGSGFCPGIGGAPAGPCPADGVVQFGELTAYTVTVDFSAVNTGLQTANATGALYPGQAFAEAVVGFASFQDGNNALLCQFAGGGGGNNNCTEGGSGASTPVGGLTTSLNFIIGRLSETIRGTVRDAQNGKPIGGNGTTSGALLTLLDAAAVGTDLPTPAPAPFPGAFFNGNGGPLANGIRLALINAAVRTDANGNFQFTGVPASHTFVVVASVPDFPPPAGYIPTITGVFATLGGAQTVLVPPTPANQGALPPIGTPGTGEILLAPGVPGVDSVAPFVAAANPADGADIDVSAAGNPKRPIILCFSEAMQTDLSFTKPVVATVDFKGLPIPADGGRPSAPDATVEIQSGWNAAAAPCGPGGATFAPNSVLTITPVNNWLAGATYGVFLAGAPAPLPGAAPLADVAGNPCCRCVAQNALGSSITAAVCSGGIPGAANTGSVLGESQAAPGGPSPSVLLFTTNGGAGVVALDGPTASLGAASADFNGATATITWPAVAGARAYEVYMSVANGDFQLIARTAPSTSPVTQMISRSWSFDDALNPGVPGRPCVTIPATSVPFTNANLPCSAGINPSAPIQSLTNPNPRVAPGFDGVTRFVVEAVIPDVGDDDSTLPPTTQPTGGTTAAGGVPVFLAPAATRALGGATFRVDVGDGLADLSDNFGAASQVRIAIAAVNSNGVVGTPGTPVVVKDNSGPQTNSTQGSVPDLITGLVGSPAPGVGVCPNNAAGATTAAPGSSTAGCGGLANAPGAWTGQGQVLQDRLDPNDVNGNGNLIEADGVADTIFIGFSEPLAAATATNVANYKLRASDGTTPARLAAISIVSATYDEDLPPGSGNTVLDAGEDTDGNGLLTRGSDANFTPGATNIKGNFFGNTFVTLRINPTALSTTPGTLPGVVDIRPGDYVEITGVMDLAGNANRPVDPTIAQNRLGDLVRPAVLAVAQAAIVNQVGTPDTITVTFSEPLGAFPAAPPSVTLTIAGVPCTAALSIDPTAPFQSGNSSVRLRLDNTLAPSIGGSLPCDVSRLAGDGTTFASDRLVFTAAVTDQAGNPISTRADTLLFNGTAGTGTFVVAGSATGIPTDITRPTLVSATFTNNAAAAADSIVLTFSERLSSFLIGPANFMFTVAGANCSGVVSVDEILTNTNTGAPVGTPGSTPIIDPFTAGDTIVTLVVAAGGGGCDLSNLVTGDRIALGPPNGVAATGEADTSGNTLNNLNDTAIYIGPPSPVAAATTGAYNVITSQ